MSMHVSIYGRLGQDPREITTGSGKAMTVCTLAVSIDVVKSDEPATQWFDITAFGSQAETLAKHGKGDLIAAMGRLQLRRWTDREGQERESWSLVAESLISARTTRPKGGKRTTQQAGQHRQKGNGQQQAAFEFQSPDERAQSLGFDDDIGF